MLKAALAGLVLSVSGFANAGLITFTDRALYEAYINGAVMDDFLDVTDGSGSTGIRSGYSWNMSDFGCASGTGQCGDNSAQNFSYDDNYI